MQLITTDKNSEILLRKENQFFLSSLFLLDLDWDWDRRSTGVRDGD